MTVFLLTFFYLSGLLVSCIDDVHMQLYNTALFVFGFSFFGIRMSTGFIVVVVIVGSIIY